MVKQPGFIAKKYTPVNTFKFPGTLSTRRRENRWNIEFKETGVHGVA
ncbi:MAG: hypothetical protein QW733_06320 [Desulfurococcaceae archaeon]